MKLCELHVNICDRLFGWLALRSLDITLTSRLMTLAYGADRWEHHHMLGMLAHQACGWCQQ